MTWDELFAKLRKDYESPEDVMTALTEVRFPAPPSPMLIIEEFITDPDKPYSYSVGTGGSGGSDGKV